MKSCIQDLQVLEDRGRGRGHSRRGQGRQQDGREFWNWSVTIQVQHLDQPLKQDMLLLQ